MTEPVKRYDPNYSVISQADDLAVEADDGMFVMHDDYARIEQECERLCLKLYDFEHGDLFHAFAERDAALKQVERLTAMLHRASKAESRPEFMQIIAEALSAKP